MYLYADDLALVSETPEGLQNLLNGLFEFCKKWHLIVSLAKTNVVIFGKRKNDVKFIYNNQTVDVVTEYKYLGTIFSSKTQDPLRKTHDHLADKAWNAIYALKSYSKNTVGQLQPVLSFKMFDTQISPIMEYAADVWFSGKEVSNLEKIQLSYIKSSLRVKKSSCTYALYAESGTFPLFVKQKIQVLKFWYRIMQLNDCHIVKKAYNSLFEMFLLGQENWCFYVKNILYSCGYNQCWDEQYASNEDQGKINEAVYKNFITECMDRIGDSNVYPKLRTYKLFKNEFKFENYLACVKNVNHCLALFRFRISSHNLRIETGRYDRPNKTPIDERTCLYCSSQDIEDEYHFIVKCPVYINERQQLLNVIRDEEILELPSVLSDEDSFVTLMKCQNEPVVRALAKYVYICLQKRSSMVL